METARTWTREERRTGGEGSSRGRRAENADCVETSTAIMACPLR